MSRIGRQPINIPNGVEVNIDAANVATVKGPKGTLTQQLPKMIIVTIDNSVITVTRPDETKVSRSMHGLTRTLLMNMIIGVTEGCSKTLEINGVGYRAEKQGKTLKLTVGKSHPVTYEDTEDIKIEVPNPNTIIVIGIDKQRVGAVAANIRGERKAEPYKGKGIKYLGEVIKRKEGKAGGKK
ncbi:MAG: 50S ribosomal protein L6 [Clostridiales bacterium]|jgi:large subunit ribosomal protein L6|nr:50S ribosomal protein L6 [Clostridiales bacterium]